MASVPPLRPMEWLRRPSMTAEERALYTQAQETIIVGRLRRAAPFGALATAIMTLAGSLRFTPEWRTLTWIVGGATTASLLVGHRFLMPRTREGRVVVTALLGLGVAATLDLLAVPTGGLGSPALPAILVVWLYGSVVAPLGMVEIVGNIVLELVLAAAILLAYARDVSGGGAAMMGVAGVGVGLMILLVGTALREQGAMQAFLVQRSLDEAERRLRVVERSRGLSAALARLAGAAAERQLGAGVVLNERFEIVRAIGSGGMGDVYEGVDRVTGSHVAVKVIHVRNGGDIVDLQRFLAEARAGASVRHEGIVRTLDVDVTSDGTLFHVMELLEGTTLAAWIASPGVRPVGAVAAVGRVLAEALAAAHEAGVVHRDVKPGNVMLTTRGPGIKVLDFGLSKILDAGGREPSVTQSQAVLGTPAYMAPEQFLATKSAGAPADVYALGVVLYEAFSGTLPFEDPTSAGLFVAHTKREPADLRAVRREVPEEVAAVVRRCLGKDADLRPRAADVARVLARHAAPGEVRLEVDAAGSGTKRVDPAATTEARTRSMRS